MKKYTKIISLALFFILNVFVAKAQNSGGFDVLGVWAYVTLDESTPVVNGFYEIVFPNPPEEVDRVDGPGSPVVWNNSYDGYTHVYTRKCVLDTEIAEANRDQIELELFVKRWTDIPTLSPGIQCYYYVILCLHNH